jgi:pimeloyl-ACP methyl ester carboxylesterase
MRILFTAALAVGLISSACAHAAPIPAGVDEQTVDLGGTELDVFTYRPASCENPALLLVFHGLNRNADRYRDYARPIADKRCMIVVAPLFDDERFPSWSYQRGGIVRHRAVQSQNNWTIRYAEALIDWARREERRPLDAYMIGHSAGGQFLSRLAAFLPTSARRIVIANPSTYVFPDLDTAAPFGLGGVFPRGSDVSNLQRYLAAPVTIFIGAEDTGDENRNDSPEARSQGVTRFDRGRNAFAAGRAMAQSRGWAFNWRLVELNGVGHSARKMFASEKAIEALLP